MKLFSLHTWTGWFFGMYPKYTIVSFTKDSIHSGLVTKVGIMFSRMAPNSQFVLTEAIEEEVPDFPRSPFIRITAFVVYDHVHWQLCSIWSCRVPSPRRP